MSVWDELRPKLEDGTATMDELLRAIAAENPPRWLRAMNVKATRRQGRPRKWTDDEVLYLRNLVNRLQVWSEMLTATEDGYCYRLPKEEIRNRIGAALTRPMSGKSLENLIRSAPKQRGIRIWRDEDYSHLFRVPFSQPKLRLHIRLPPP